LTPLFLGKAHLLPAIHAVLPAFAILISRLIY